MVSGHLCLTVVFNAPPITTSTTQPIAARLPMWHKFWNMTTAIPTDQLPAFETPYFLIGSQSLLHIRERLMGTYQKIECTFGHLSMPISRKNYITVVYPW